MSEQKRIRRESQRHRQVKDEQPTVQTAGSNASEIGEQLKKLDAAIGEAVANTATPAPAASSSAVVGQATPHQVLRPLSEEAFVKNFRQTSGE